MKLKPTLRISELHRLKRILRRSELITVCEESRCPNISDCFRRGTATFMILGDRCTRGCTFCNVERGSLRAPDPEEPYRLLEAVRNLKLRYVVITSVTRDDLPDGGADHFAECVRILKENVPGVKVEVLIPDFKGRRDSLLKVLRAGPDVLAHNVETVPRLYPTVRRGASYERSLGLLRQSKEISPQVFTKSALILGLGETLEEVVSVLRDLRRAGCDFITVGQYYAPSLKHHPVIKHYTPEEFRRIERIAYSLGFRFVASGPNVRSSYRASEGYVKGSRSPEGRKL